MAMTFFATFNLNCLRVNLSVALVAMVNSTYIRELEASEAAGNDNGVNMTSVTIESCVKTDRHANITDVSSLYGFGVTPYLT